MSTIKTDNENLVLHAEGVKDVEIQTNGSTKLTVKSSGNVGIGTSSPSAKLDVNTRLNGSGLGIFVDRTTRTGGEEYVRFGTTSVADFMVNSSGNVGIGTSSPSAKLSVRNETLNNTPYQTLSNIFANVSNESSGETFYPATSSFGLSFSRNWAGSAVNTDVSGIYGFSSAGWRGGMVLRTKHNNNSYGGTDRDAMVLSPAGIVTMPYQPAFGAYNGATGQSYSGLTTLKYTSTTYNIGSVYSATTGRFTAPVDGIYSFDATFLEYPNASSGYVSMYASVNGSSSATTNTSHPFIRGQLSTQESLSISGNIKLSANDYVEVRIYGTGTYYIGTGHGQFNMRLLG